ncbi:TolC family protein [Pedobacter chinensis]|uniref:TolC family protein n=1 Tax=Pedobacter chinensis TaxID=2282421 RepID=A0A369Q013_9SPHI|nr:TolC family protein [Pedobacter chinensis]RDC57830.1 TolC family protein [Pedobacter chinensis]
MNTKVLRIPRSLDFLFLVFLFILVSINGNAQQRLSLKDLPSLVKNNLPQLNSAKANAEAEKLLIDYEKRGLMPDLNIGYQANVATFNNITGMSYPGLMMPISGPPSQNNDLNFVPGSAATALLTWKPISFGQRKSAIDRATAQFKLANADYNEQAFRYQFAAIHTYLEAVFFKQVISNNRASIKRYSSSLEQALVLAKTGLRPGVDTIQMQSSLAQAEIELLQSENAFKQKLIVLASLIGSAERSGNLILTDTTFKNISVSADTSSGNVKHPYFITAVAQKELTEAKLDELKKTWRPKLEFWGNVYGRGSGINASGTINKTDGFNLSRSNIGAGVQISFPVFQFYQLNAKKKQYGQLVQADEFKLKQLQLDLNKQTDIAWQQYKSNIAILNKQVVRLKSATDAFNSLKLSYESGLIDFARLAQSQYELQQAEINSAAALLVIQRSLLDISIAKGDLDLFFQQIQQ